jgi:hypothetical protein
VQFYEELYNQKEISNNFREVIDETDQTFFDAIYQDY